MAHSYTEENYLKALFALQEKGQEVGVKELADRLGITMPTVTAMMKRLATKDLVVYESYRPLRLTEEGRRQSALILRKHRLTEMFLVQVMGFGWEQVHEIAEQVEHVQAPDFFERMDQMLGHPRQDPHGSPIPDAVGQIEPTGAVGLAGCAPGRRVRLAAVLDSSHAFLTYLNSRGLALGQSLEVQAVEPFDGSMTVLLAGQPLTLSRTVAERLLVEG